MKTTGTKSLGIVRKVDELGRIVLPIELRRNLDIAVHDEVEIYVEGHSVIIRKYEPTCIFCASDSDVVQYCNKNICRKCIKAMWEIK